MTCAFALFETDNPELCSSFTFLDRHQAIVFDLRLQMTIGRRFLPKCVNPRFPAFLHHLRKARRFHFQKLHVGREGPSGRPFRSRSLGFWRARRSRPLKVRQRTTARRIRLPLLHSCSGGVRTSSIHSPWRRRKIRARSTSCNRVFKFDAERVDSSSRSSRHGGHYSSAKRQVCFDPSLVRFVNLRSLAQLTPAFRIF